VIYSIKERIKNGKPLSPLFIIESAMIVVPGIRTTKKIQGRENVPDVFAEEKKVPEKLKVKEKEFEEEYPPEEGPMRPEYIEHLFLRYSSYDTKRKKSFPLTKLNSLSQNIIKEHSFMKLLEDYDLYSSTTKLQEKLWIGKVRSLDLIMKMLGTEAKIG